jgi:hypothetical protein
MGITRETIHPEKRNTMKTHPTKSDNRWTITREHTGKPAPQYVIRFCGDWIDSAPTYAAAAIAEAHHSVIGTRPDEGFTIEETTHAPKNETP